MTIVKKYAGLVRSVRSWGALGLLLALTVSVGLGSGQTSSCVPPPSGMVAWWPLDEQNGATAVNDIAAGFNNVGTPKDANGNSTSISSAPSGPPAGPVPVTAPPLSLPSGKVGSALYFYGPYIEVGNHPDLNFGTGPFSIDAWVYYVPLSPVPPGSGPFIAPIVDKFDASTNTGFALFLYIDTAGTHLRFRMWDGSGASVAGFPVPSIPPLTWGHIVVTVDRPGPGVSVYINGTAAVTGAPMVTGSIDNNEPLWIGKSRLHTLLNAGFREIAIDELEIFNRALTAQEIQAIYQAGSAGKCKEQQPSEPTADLGDAPDSTNHPNKPMTAYPSVTAKFPTVFDPATGLPQGPKHFAPKGLAWLGKDVSFENEADLPPDADGVTNIDPINDKADQDKFDDGVALPIAIPGDCGQTQFNYTVTNGTSSPVKLYVNVWFDFNRDGDWNDPIQKCPLGPAVTGSFTEWAVQNQLITANPGTNTFTTPVFGAANPTKGSEMWMRITLTDQPIAPANGADGSGPAGGYKHGETEDYLLRLPYTEICGVKFNDLDGNGKQDPGEPGLANWVIEVKDANGNFMGYAVTDKDGSYCITVPEPGKYTVSEQQQPGWTPTTPASVTVTVPPAAKVNFGNQQGKCDREIKKTVTPNPVQSGQQVTITLTVTNVGTAPCPVVAGINVADPQPSGLTFQPPVSANKPGWLCGLGPIAFCTSTAPLLPGPANAVTITFKATVTAPAGSSIQNCAEVTNVGDANQNNNKSCVTITVTGLPPPPDLMLRKTHDGNLVSGRPMVYALVVSNVGRGPTTGPTTVTDVLPEGLAFVSATGAGWSCAASGQNVTCRMTGPLTPGSTTTIQLRVNVIARPGTQITNCATVETAGDANRENNRGCDTGTVQGG